MARPATPAAGVTPADDARLAFRIFRDQDGLPQNSVQTVSTDAEGRIWAGTQDGAAVYNGRVWRIVNMPSESVSNSVRVVLQASNGDVWFGCDGAVNRLRGDEWTVFTRADGVPEGWTRTMLELAGPDGRPEIWIGTDGGYGRFDGASWTEASHGTPLEAVPVRCMLVDPADGRLWIGTDGSGLWSLEAPWRGAPVRESALPASSVFCCARVGGATPEIAVGTGSGAFRRAAGGWEPVPLLDGRPFSVRCLLETRTARGESVL